MYYISNTINHKTQKLTLDAAILLADMPRHTQMLTNEMDIVQAQFWEMAKVNFK